jgi:exopolysaccharide biosynthesis protein
MLQFNCYEALNLDGGGSSALIVAGKLINSPIGLNSQREVMSVIGIVSKN